jgi:hypothetical protein
VKAVEQAMMVVKKRPPLQQFLRLWSAFIENAPNPKGPEQLRGLPNQ